MMTSVMNVHLTYIALFDHKKYDLVFYLFMIYLTLIFNCFQVDGVDLRTATHDKAVEVIRKSTSPVTFLVQSLVDSSVVSNGS